MGLALGSTIGSAIAFGANFNKNSLAGVSYGVLAAWAAIHVAACLFAYILFLPPHRVRSPLGHPIPAARDIMGLDTTPLSILKEIGRTLTSPKVLFAFAAMFSSDFWLVFIGSWNAAHFTLRTRSLNSFCYWLIQLPVAYLLSFILDRPGWSRRKRGTVGFCSSHSLTVLVSPSLTMSPFSSLDSLSHPLRSRYRLLGRPLELAGHATRGRKPCGQDHRHRLDIEQLWTCFHSLPTLWYLVPYRERPLFTPFLEKLAQSDTFSVLFVTQYHVVLVYYFSSLASEGNNKLVYYAAIFKGLQGTGLVSFSHKSIRHTRPADSLIYCSSGHGLRY